jgi:hypothetical protein
MKKVACLAVLIAIVPAAAWADCVYPKKPARAPDGARAPRAEMITAKKAVDQYQADVNAYLSCLKSEHEAAMANLPAGTSDDDKKKMVARWEKKNDAAVDEAQEVADSFNEQLRACKARPDGCSK